MGTTRRFFATALGAAVLAVAAPGAAAAASPSPLDRFLAPAVAGVVATDVAGIAQASATPGSANAAAVEFPQLVRLGKAGTTKGTSKVVVIGVAGKDLLTKQGNAAGGANTGFLFAVGDGLDALNQALCPTHGAAKTTCITALESSALSTSSPDGGVKANSAMFSVARVQLDGMTEGVALVPVTASTTASSGHCIDLATAFVASGTGALALARIVGPKLKLAPILSPC